MSPSTTRGLPRRTPWVPFTKTPWVLSLTPHCPARVTRAVSDTGSPSSNPLNPKGVRLRGLPLGCAFAALSRAAREASNRPHIAGATNDDNDDDDDDDDDDDSDDDDDDDDKLQN